MQRINERIFKESKMTNMHYFLYRKCNFLFLSFDFEVKCGRDVFLAGFVRFVHTEKLNLNASRHEICHPCLLCGFGITIYLTSNVITNISLETVCFYA